MAPPPSREELIGLASAGRPWDALPELAKALSRAPRDVGLRFLFASNLADAGLATLAREQLGLFPPAARALPDADALGCRLDELPDDREPPDRRTQRARLAVAALGDRAPALRDALRDWLASREALERFIATDGSVVWRDAPGAEPEDLRGLHDSPARASARVDRLLAEHARKSPGPVTIDGARTPWLLLELATRLGPDASGYRPEIVLVHDDPMTLLDALSMTDAADTLADAPLRLFARPDARGAFAAWARERFDLESLGPVLATGAADPTLEPIESLATTIRGEQSNEMARLRGVVESQYAGRGEEWWAARYERALAPGSAEPLRVLIPTCRYTTFVRHAAEDLRRAFARRGADARLLIEPDDHARLSAIAQLRAAHEFEPDLVVLINYTRRATSLPSNVPFVCWIQDQMPHLLDERAGRASTPLDFLCGHTYPHLFERYAYPAQRALSAPVVIDPEKFGPEPAPPELLDEHACEIAYVSHHSEAPAAMRDRLIRESGDERLGHVIEWTHDRITQLASAAHERVIVRDVADEAPMILREHVGADADPGLVHQLKAQCIDPLAERILRHQTLEWAASIAERRGWRLRVHGRGWESGPFARYARPEIEHGQSLRACYQAARVHLHASPSTAVHQRVMECAASGGLPLCRLTHQMLASQALADAALSDAPPDAPIAVADSAGLMDWCAQLQRLGLGSPGAFTPPAGALARQRALAPTGKLGWTARWLLGDFSQTTFHDEDSLERLIERAVERPAWRESLSAGIRGRVRERATTDALADSLLTMIRASLGGATARAAA